MIIVVALLATLMGIAVPVFQDVMSGIVHGQAQQLIESELQQARLKAVTSNRVMRVRFNCPSAGQFRTVELIGTPASPAPQDTATNRCSGSVYPYPPADRNALTLPNLDGPVKQIDTRITFGAAPTIEFWPTGAAYGVSSDGTSVLLAGGETSITLKKGTDIRTVKVNSLGKVEGVQ